MSTYYAEEYRGFLLYLLRQVWKQSSGPYDVSKDKDASKLNGNGIYFIFWSAYKDADNIDQQDQIYPLYVGITGRSFKKRLSEHISNGVIHKITSGEWPKTQGIVNLPVIVAYVVDMPLPVAKFFESVFLYAFDFAMNVEENGEERPGLDPTTTASVLAGWGHFKESYRYIKSYFNEADKMVSDEEMEHGIWAIDKYDFGKHDDFSMQEHK